MSEPYYLGAWVHVINVHWGGGRFLGVDEHDNSHWDFSGLNVRFVERAGEWVWVTTHDTSYGGMFVPDYQVFNTYPPIRQYVVPYNGVVKTTIYPGTNDGQVTYDVHYQANEVKKLGDGSYTGMPIYLIRTKNGFLGGANADNSGLAYPILTTDNIYIAQGAVRYEDDPPDAKSSQDIYKWFDWDEPYLMVADITVSILGGNPTLLYAYDEGEAMLAYNGKDDCTGAQPLAYAKICTIGSGIILSFAATACVTQPMHSSNTDLVITSAMIRKQQVFPHDTDG